MSEIAYVGIGSNIEPRMERIDQAIASLEGVGKILSVSSIYETKPYGYSDQPAFLNAVAALVTDRTPIQLRTLLKEIEQRLGRRSRERWHEREIDLDILFLGDVVMNSEELILPHADLVNRSFVVLPLAEIALNIVHPVLGKTVEELSEVFRGIAESELRIVRTRQ